MRSRSELILAAGLVAAVAVAALAGTATTLGLAALEHEIMVRTIGQDGIVAIDDTLPSFLMVAADYGAGLIVGVVALIVGWRSARRHLDE